MADTERSIVVREPQSDSIPISSVPLRYEQLLDSDPRWALSEGSRHFEENSAVFKALRGITERLKGLGINYAIVGGMALFRHGLRRFTEDVDILVTKEDLRIIHKKLTGLGYLPPFAKSKHLRDTDLGVRIEFLTTGDFPGDGKKKPIAFPKPLDASFESDVDGIRYVHLHTLVELKLASGMTNRGRLKDLSDVIELIKVLDLPRDFVSQLNPYVREKFNELWKEARKRYVMTWRNKWLTTDAKSIEEMAALLRDAAEELEQLRTDGVVLETGGGEGDDYARLVTTDPAIAQKYGMIDEAEYWETDENQTDQDTESQ